MTGFVETFVTTIADSASKVARQHRGSPGVRRLLKLLATKRRILVTTHVFPDPDAIASVHAMAYLLKSKLAGTVSIVASIKGQNSAGINGHFTELSGAELSPWDEATLGEFDAVVLLDVQPSFSTSPLPPGVVPTAVIDHHRSRGRRQKVAFRDVRPDVGATASIVFSYLRELQLPISPQLASTLLYAIESDLAGAAGNPGDLDNVAMSNLMLVADMRRLYQMRYAALPAEFYVNFARGINEASYAGKVLATFLGPVESPAMPAVVADFMLRFSGITWVLVGAMHAGRAIVSIRTSEPKASAGELMRKLLHRIGDGGGHRTKAGGHIDLKTGSPAEIDRLRKTLRRRLIKLVGLPPETRFVKLSTAAGPTVPTLTSPDAAKPTRTTP